MMQFRKGISHSDSRLLYRLLKVFLVLQLHLISQLKCAPAVLFLVLADANECIFAFFLNEIDKVLNRN